MYKISVIIPVYNAQNSVKYAIDSVINQTIGFDNIELILVDDNSNDGSKQIITDYANQYDNIKAIFLEENSGSPSIPRNIGIDNATAPYLMFLDNDDEYFHDYCEVLYNSITRNNVDIVNCNHSNKLNNKVYIPEFIDEINVNETIVEGLDKFHLKLAAWGNIYNTNLIKQKNIKFPTTLYEDGVFFLNCILKTSKPIIRLLEYTGYVYLIENNESITHKASLKTLSGFLEGYNLCGDLLTQHNQDDTVKQILFNNFINMAIFILIKLDDLDNGIKQLYEFEKSLDFEINLGSKPLNMINSKIMNQQFKQAKLLLKAMGLFYNNKNIKNYIFVKFTNLKLLE